MTDFSQHDIDRMLENTVLQTAYQKKLLKNSDIAQNPKTAEARQAIKQNKVIKHLDNHSDTLKSSTVAIEETIYAFKKFAKVFEGGIVGEMIIKYATNLTTTYQKLSDYGQTFGGSMLEMQEAAADAALPLDKFAKVIEEFGPAVANFGTKRFFDLGKQVRGNISQFGMLGMTLDQVNAMVGDYGETQRVWGQISNLNDQKAASSMADLAVETSALSSLTGKSRTQTLKDMNEGLRDVSLRLKMRQMEGDSAQKAGTNIGKAMALFASQTGEAGTALTQMLAQTLGKGSAIFADQATTLFEAGAGQIVNSFDNFASTINGASDLTDDQLGGMIAELKDQAQDLMPTLQLQVKAGNKSAETVAKWLTEMTSMTAEQIKQRKAQQETKTLATNFMLGLENMWNNLSGRVMKGFFGAISNLTKWMDDSDTNSLFMKLGDNLEEMGTKVGKFISTVFTEDTLKKIGEVLGYAAKTIPAFVEGVLYAFKVATPVLEGVAAVFGWLVEKVVSVLGVFKWLHDGLAQINETMATFATGLLAIAAYFAVKGILGRIFGSVGKISIATATINVASGSMGGGSPSSLSNEIPGKNTAANAAKKAEVGLIERSGGTAAKVAKGAMGALKGVGRLIGPATAIFSALELGATWMDDTKTREQKFDDTITSVFEGVGGFLGGLGGAALGTALMPGVGTAAGGIAGGVGGSMLGGSLASGFNSWRHGTAGATPVVPGAAGADPASVVAPMDRSVNGVNMNEEQFQKFNGLSGVEAVQLLQTIAQQNGEANALARAKIAIDASSSTKLTNTVKQGNDLLVSAGM